MPAALPASARHCGLAPASMSLLTRTRPVHHPARHRLRMVGQRDRRARHDDEHDASVRIRCPAAVLVRRGCGGSSFTVRSGCNAGSAAPLELCIACCASPRPRGSRRARLARAFLGLRRLVTRRYAAPRGWARSGSLSPSSRSPSSRRARAVSPSCWKRWRGTPYFRSSLACPGRNPLRAATPCRARTPSFMSAWPKLHARRTSVAEARRSAFGVGLFFSTHARRSAGRLCARAALRAARARLFARRSPTALALLRRRRSSACPDARPPLRTDDAGYALDHGTTSRRPPAAAADGENRLQQRAALLVAPCRAPRHARSRVQAPPPKLGFLRSFGSRGHRDLAAGQNPRSAGCRCDELVGRRSATAGRFRPTSFTCAVSSERPPSLWRVGVLLLADLQLCLETTGFHADIIYAAGRRRRSQRASRRQASAAGICRSISAPRR